MLVDCLTLWLTNLMVQERAVAAEIERLLEVLPSPAGLARAGLERGRPGRRAGAAMARAFVDHAGLLHQRLAERADAVLLMTAGLPQRLK